MNAQQFIHDPRPAAKVDPEFSDQRWFSRERDCPRWFLVNLREGDSRASVGCSVFSDRGDATVYANATQKELLDMARCLIDAAGYIGQKGGAA